MGTGNLAGRGERVMVEGLSEGQVSFVLPFVRS